MRFLFEQVPVIGNHRLSDPTFTHGSWPNHPELIRRDEKLKDLIFDTLMDPEASDPRPEFLLTHPM